jgi:tetratricopeptide (TPR) repeat protein
MTYLALLALVVVAALLYQARGIIGVILADAKLPAGDYDGALRRLRWAALGTPNAPLLHKQGLILTLAGRPAEAETSYRKALDTLDVSSAYPRGRLLAALGHALIDLARYADAEKCFRDAVEAGDPSGNSQDGLAELRLQQGVEFDQALDFTTQAIAHAKRPVYYALQAWALASLGRSEEANEALAESLRLPATASLHWRAAMACQAMQQTEEAGKHFQAARDLDPHGKYGQRA